MKIIEKIIDLTTGEEVIAEREATAEEIAERQEALAKTQAKQAEQATKEAARKAVFDKLGLTADEVATLLA